MPWLLGAFAVLWIVGRTTGGPDAPTSAPSGTSGHERATPSAGPTPSVAATPTRSAKPQRPKQPPARPGTALAALASLPVKGRAPMTGYSREEFGQAWLDADRNGCDTRNDTLGRDLVQRSYKPGTRDCVVLTGVLHDPYLGQDVAFVRGDGDLVDIDHVVALGNAWATGAAPFDIHKRAAFANDPLNLLAVDLHSNRSKGDGDAATWLPAYRPFRCSYVSRQIAVKKKYGLWLTAPEHAAMARVLGTCPDQRLPVDRSQAPTRVDQHITDPAASSAPRPLAGGGSVSYANCTAVRAAGAAPIHRGDPGYSRKLDRDGDGVGCE